MSFVADFRASHSKDASSQWMKQALIDAMSDRVPAIPERKQLIPRDNSVLAAHQPPCFPRLVS